MTQFPRRAAVAALLCMAAVAAGAQTNAPVFDPVTSDPPVDAQNPATLAGFTVSSGGHVMNGRAWIAQGKGPHPNVLLLHGLPGLEQNIDLAQAMRRAGWNVFTFHYRGSWGSAGEFSLASALEDTAAVLEFLRTSAATRPNWRIDPARIVLVGHSMGGFAALMVGAADPQVKAIASMAGFDFGATGIAATENPDIRALFERFYASQTSLKISDAKVTVQNWLDASPRMKFSTLERPLATKSVLLIAGTRDTISVPARHHAPLANTLRASAGGKFTEVLLDADHGFSDKRIALTRALLGWLEQQR